MQIDFQKDWKGRGKDSYIFAGKINYAGEPAYLAAIVMKGKDNRFYLHEVVLDDGGYIKAKIDSSEHIKTRVTGQAGVTRNSELSKKRLTQDETKSNTEDKPLQFPSFENEGDKELYSAGERKEPAEMNVKELRRSVRAWMRGRFGRR